MITAHAQVPTPFARKYLTQLSKHWSHRFPALTYTAERADIPLPLGPCVLEASDDKLELTVSAATPTDAERMQQVVADHLRRFAHREILTIDWRG
jgi:hypothetical protein